MWSLLIIVLLLTKYTLDFKNPTFVKPPVLFNTVTESCISGKYKYKIYCKVKICFNRTIA